jgi:hypothetical protein
MQQYERIAIWVLLIMITIRVFFMNRQMSFYTANSPVSLMDLKEFDAVAPEIKQMYQDNIVTKLAPAIGRKLTGIWNDAANAKVKTSLTTGSNGIPTAITKVVANIDAIPTKLPGS